jgi:hypothetical protein
VEAHRHPIDGELSPVGELLLADIATPSPTCEECGRPWLQSFEMWRTFLTDDEPRRAVNYCPDCAQSEFDPWPSRELATVPRERFRTWDRYGLGAALAASVIANVLAVSQ